MGPWFYGGTHQILYLNQREGKGCFLNLVEKSVKPIFNFGRKLNGEKYQHI